MLTAQFTCLAGPAVQEFAKKERKNCENTYKCVTGMMNGTRTKLIQLTNNTKRENNNQDGKKIMGLGK